MPPLIPSVSLQDLQEKLLIAQKKYNELFDKTDRTPPTIQTISNLAAAYNDLGKHLLDAKKFEEAIEVLEKAFALPENKYTAIVIINLTIAYNDLGADLTNSQKYEEAIEVLKKAFAIPKNNNTDIIITTLAHTYNSLGADLTNSQKYEEAIEVFKKAFALPKKKHPAIIITNLANAYNKLGKKYYEDKKYEEALATFKEAINLPKNNNTDTVIKNLTTAYNKLTQQLKSNGKFTESAALLERGFIDEAKIPAPDDLIQEIIELHTHIAKNQKDNVVSIIDKALSRALDAASPYSATYKQIIVNYHSVCGKELAEALVSKCAINHYKKMQQHITILKEFLSTTPEVVKQLNYIYLSLAKHSGDLDYLSHIDKSLFSAEELQEINILKANVYFEKANKFRNEGNFEKAIEFLEKCKKLESEKEGLAELGKSIYLQASKILKESDPEKAFEYLKIAKELDKTLMTDPANKELAYEITINLAKVYMQNDTEASIKKVIQCLSEAEKHRKSPDTSKLKIEGYLKLAYGEFQDHYLGKATEVLATLELDYTTDLYVTQICTRYLRTEDEEETAESHKAAAKALLDKIQYEILKGALDNIIRGDTRYAAACEQISDIITLGTELSQAIANELLPLIPQGIVTAVNTNKSCPELLTQKARSEESLDHEEWQVHKRMLKLDDEAYKRFEAKESASSHEAFLTWNIKGATYKWEGYTKYEDREKAVYQIQPNLFAMIDPTLKLGAYGRKFYTALTHGMAQTAHGTKGIKTIGDGFELKILGVDGAGDARLVASKIYSCEPAPHKHGVAAAVATSSPSKAKTKSPPKSSSVSSDDETSAIVI